MRSELVPFSAAEQERWAEFTCGDRETFELDGGETAQMRADRIRAAELEDGESFGAELLDSSADFVATSLSSSMTRDHRLVDGAPAALCAVVARGAISIGVAVLHGGQAVAFMTPAQAESQGRRLLELAKIARNPGKPPCEILG